MNRFEAVVGYELLFRSPGSLSCAAISNPLKATSMVMFELLSSFGIHEIVGNLRGFINITTEMLMSDTVELLPSDAIGLELLESTIITPSVIRRCRELKKLGFVIALDNHSYNPDYFELYDGLVDIIKLDLIHTPLDAQYRFVDLLGHFPVKLLADKVDNRAVYLRSRRIGFELFQGYFFARPSVVQKARMGNVTSTFFQLKQQLTHDANIDEIEETFKQNPSMTYKLLMLVNSVSYASREKIRTVRHALMQLGMEHLRRWVQLAVFVDDSGQGLDSALLDMAVTRAAFMEELARLDTEGSNLIRPVHPDEAFMTGTLSILTDIYDVSVDEIITNLYLSDEIRAALLNRNGDLGTLLCLVEMMERIELDEAAESLERLGIPLKSVQNCQRNAYNWRSKFAS
ncbi:MAG: HDOD domain-containing protein [Geobacteraceae bacterium]|nr:HDOD domain-containing protein [Geobacteraceae bacterium]